MSVEPRLPNLTPGTVFAGHRIERVVGRGGMGVVYRALHLALDQARAVKVVLPELSRDASYRARFQRESRLAAQVEHPNVIPVHAAGDEDGLLYISMRWVAGRDLGDLIAEAGRLPPRRALTILEQVAAALDAAHSHGLIHRDVKPQNVLLEPRDGVEHAYLSDFGVSKLAASDSAVTSTGAFVGTVDYVAPEQLEGGAVDGRADVYALACLAYHTLVGEVPFPRDSHLAKMFAHANAPAPAASANVPELPPALDEVIAGGMSKDPSDRPRSAGELIAAAEAAAGLEGPGRTSRRRLPTGRGAPTVALGKAASPAGRTTARARDAASPGRRLAGRRSAVLAAIALVALVAGVVVLLAGGGPDEAPTIAERDPAVGAPIPVGRGPTHLSVGAGAVWVSNRDDGTVTEIDPVDRRPAGRPIRVGPRPTGIAAGRDGVWVASDARRTVERIDPDGGGVGPAIDVGSAPADVTIGEGAVWVANEDDDSVTRIDERDREASEIPVGDGPRAVAVGEGAAWVTNIEEDTVTPIDATSGEPATPIEVGRRPSEVAVGAGGVWVVNNAGNSVTRIDPLTEATQTIPVGAGPRGIAVGDPGVWVAIGERGTLVRIDPVTRAVVAEPVQVGREPADVAFGEGAVWVADFGADRVVPVTP